MVSRERHEVERKFTSILRILKDCPEPLGSRLIANRLKEMGLELGERAVRYHLKIMDERGLTRPVGRDGRLITEQGKEELRNAMVGDKVGFIIAKIELLAYRTTFDWQKRSGQVPINMSLFPKARWQKGLDVMRNAFKAGLCVSDLIAVAEEGERLGDITVPTGKVGLATVCSIIINGALLKAGIPMDSRFGGILQLRDGKPLRFIELIEYSGSSLDPSEIYITSRMTSVAQAAKTGSGKILANFREIPALCKPLADEVIAGLKEARLGGVILLGETSEPLCEIPVGLGKLGMILLGGLNPVAAAVESGIEVENTAMSSLIEYESLTSFWNL